MGYLIKSMEYTEDYYDKRVGEMIAENDSLNEKFKTLGDQKSILRTELMLKSLKSFQEDWIDQK